MNKHDLLKNAPLGKSSAYVSQYQPDLLFRIPRSAQRNEIGIQDILPFQGNDIWNAFEISWLNAKGKPMVAAAELIVPCESPYIFESKSLKLYLSSFYNTSFDSLHAVEKVITRDLSEVTGAIVKVKLLPLGSISEKIVNCFQGICLDDLDIACDTYTIQPSYLSTGPHFVTETLYSDLLKTNCLITGQPDLGSVHISYTGNKIQHEGLLKYIVSFRNHNEFHEPSVERMFTDILSYCAPEKLFVYARYTRRGGIDINPYRANYAIQVENTRLIRQ